MDNQSTPTTQSTSNADAQNTGHVSEQPSSSGSSPAHYPDDGEVPGPSGLHQQGTSQSIRPKEYDDEWYLETSYSSSDESIVSESSGYDVRCTWSSVSAGGYLPEVSVSSTSVPGMCPRGKRKQRYRRKVEDPTSVIRHEYNRIYGSLSVESISSNESALDLYYFPEFSYRYNVFEKPIVGDARSPWQQRLELQRLEEIANRKFEQAFQNDTSSERGIEEEDIRERISAWLVQREEERASLPVCTSDTELLSRKRKRDDSTEERPVAKRSKSETDVGREQRKKRKRFAKMGRRGRSNSG